MVEAVGFEPTSHISVTDGLASRCLRPLGHTSGLVAPEGLEPPHSRLSSERYAEV